MAFENMKARMQARATAGAAETETAPAVPATPPAAGRPRTRPMAAAKVAEPAPAAEEEIVVEEETAPEPAPVAQKAAPRTPAKAPAGNNALSFFDAGKASSALMAYVARADNNSFQDSPFPISILTSGNSGGLLDAMKGTPGDIVSMMPAGRQPFQAVFLGYRQVVVLWPFGYDEAAETKEKPTATGVIAPDSDEDIALLQAAAINYMFTPKDAKDKFDQCGHPRPYMELLVYLPKLDHLCVIRTVSHQESLSCTMKSLAKCLPEGQIKPTPVTFQPITVEKSSKPKRQPDGTMKTQTWKMHHFELSLAIDANAKAMFEKFQAFAADVKSDADLMADFTSWATNTVTDDIRERLTVAKSL